MEHVEIRNVSKRFGHFDAIKDLSLTVEKGQFCALLGPSGCGKSTLLRLIAGLEAVTEGQIFIDGRDVTNVPPAKRSIAMVFQSYALYPHMSVRDNIAFSMDIAGVPKAERIARADEIARMLQLEELMDRRPAQLSGGQRQRVAIGRSLVRDPSVFLFDEPLSNLDAMLRVQMRLELANLHQQLKATMIYVTHDQVEAMTLADKIVVLDKGRVSQIGAPLELYNQPANKFVASFIGSPAMNFLNAELESTNGKMAKFNLSDSGQIEFETREPVKKTFSGPVELGIRPEHIKAVSSDDPSASIKGQVRIAEHLGNSTLLHVDTGAGRLTIQGDGADTTKAGDNIGIVIQTTNMHAFGEDGQAI